MIRYSKRDPYFRKKLLTSIIGQKLLDIEKITWVDPLEFKEKFANLTSTIDIVLNEGKMFLIVSGEAPFVKYGGGNGWVFEIRSNTGVDINSTLGNDALHFGQKEVSIPDGVLAQDIIGVYKKTNRELVEFIPNPNYIP